MKPVKGSILMIIDTYFNIKRRIKWIYRKTKWIPYRIKMGFWPDDLWSLDATIAEFIYPRLVEFKRINHGFPSHCSETEWNEKLDYMIFAFGKWREIWELDSLTDESRERIQKGLELFSEYYFDLWD